ncbi:MAG TPA: hypothetical protein VFD39_11210 [Trueperaceae bacterium]|nr:hypothetical protein [Trueperaceae bacterium]
MSVLFGVAVAVLVFWAAGQRAPVYAARASVFASPASGASAELQANVVPSYALEVYASAVSTDELTSRASERLSSEHDLDLSSDALRDAVSVTIERAPGPTTGFIRVQARAGAADSAESIANTVAEELVAWQQQRAEALLRETLASWRERVATLDQRIESIGVAAQGAVERAELTSLTSARADAVTQQTALEAMRPIPLLEVFEPATGSADLVAPNPARNAAVAFAVAVLLGYGVFLARQLDEPRQR